jgi:hypothetical protein
MSNYSHEYTKPSVTSNGCSYTTLDSYNQNYFGRGVVGAPRMSQTRSAEVVILPSYGAIGYNQFSVNMPSCSGYYDINSAYPANSGACGNFTSNLCG